MGVSGPQDLYTLINVTMNPWATTNDFVQLMANEFQTIANEELRHAVGRNVQTPDHHGFIIQGLEGDRVCGVHLPMFNMQNHRWQLIISFKLPEKEHALLRDLKKKDPETFFTVGNLEPHELTEFIKDGARFKARLDMEIPKGKDSPPLAEIEVTDVKILYKRSMRHDCLALDYPEAMTFYAYSAQRGTNDTPIYHIDHFLNVAIDTQLNSDSISIEVDKGQDVNDLLKNKGAWFQLMDIHESALQPLLQDENATKKRYEKPGINWVPGAKFRFRALSAEDGPPKLDAPVLFSGVLTLGQSVFADSQMINMDAEIPEKPDVVHVHHATNDLTCLGLSQSNVSGLVAEYPNFTQMPELRNRNQAAKMRAFKNHIFEHMRFKDMKI
jgi:hypothetical protein